MNMSTTEFKLGAFSTAAKRKPVRAKITASIETRIYVFEHFLSPLLKRQIVNLFIQIKSNTAITHTRRTVRFMGVISIYTLDIIIFNTHIFNKDIEIIPSRI